MEKILNFVATLAGLVGVLVCAGAGVSRLMGDFYMAGYQSTTVFGLGTALMVFACLLKLEVLLAARR